MHSKRGELDYKSMTDEQLVDMFKRGDEIAAAEIYTRYKNTVRLKSRPYFILGADRDDIVQEGMIGLFKAMRDYSRQADRFSHVRRAMHNAPNNHGNTKRDAPKACAA